MHGTKLLELEAKALGAQLLDVQQDCIKAVKGRDLLARELRHRRGPNGEHFEGCPRAAQRATTEPCACGKRRDEIDAVLAEAFKDEK